MKEEQLQAAQSSRLFEFPELQLYYALISKPKREAKCQPNCSHAAHNPPNRLLRLNTLANWIKKHFSSVVLEYACWIRALLFCQCIDTTCLVLIELLPLMKICVLAVAMRIPNQHLVTLRIHSRYL